MLEKKINLSLSYNYKNKLALVVIFYIQNLRHYILIRKTKVIVNSNPMLYLLSWQVINGKVSYYIIILQEFGLEVSTPKSKNFLALTEFISNLPISVVDPPLDDDLPDEHFFTILLDDAWYGNILIYL